MTMEKGEMVMRKVDTGQLSLTLQPQGLIVDYKLPFQYSPGRTQQAFGISCLLANSNEFAAFHTSEKLQRYQPMVIPACSFLFLFLLFNPLYSI